MSNTGTAKDMLIAEPSDSFESTDFEYNLIANEMAILRDNAKDSLLVAGLFDDHKRHLKQHLRLAYKVRTWVHMLEHLVLMRQKSKLGLDGITNSNIIGNGSLDMRSSVVIPSGKGNA
jgi:hypothetical protein